MLFNFDTAGPLFLIGQGITSREFAKTLSNHGIDRLAHVSVEELDSVPYKSQCIIAMRSIAMRRQVIDQYRDKFMWPSFVHSLSDVIDKQGLGKGIWVDSFSHIGIGATSKDFSMLSSQCLLSHNAVLGENCFLAPGTIVLGSATIGNDVFFGARSTVIDRCSIVSDVFLLTGSTVHKNITIPGRYFNNRKIS